MAQLTPEQIQAANAAFLTHSIEKIIPCNTGDTAFGLGKKLRFTVPVIPGWAATIRLRFDITNTVTIGTGTAILSQAAPFNVFQNMRLIYGGQELRNHHPYWVKAFRQSEEHDGTMPWYGGVVPEAYRESLFTSAPGVANGANTWTGHIDIPLQISKNHVAGLLPMGSSASPITLEVDCASAVYGSDPLLNPVVVTGNTTAAFTGTVTAVVYYRIGQSPHNPQIQVPTPTIGHFAKIIQYETAVNMTTGPVFQTLSEPSPALKVGQILIVPTNGSGDFSPFANIAGAAFDLDPSQRYLDYTTSGAGIMDLWRDQRNRYGNDLDPGVVIWDFLSGSDAKKPDSPNAVNLYYYNSARAGIHFNGALAGSGNRIVTALMHMYELGF